jgi:hypothetical protein
VAPPVPGSYSPIRDLLGRSLGRSTVPGPLQDPDGGEGTAAITLGEPIGIEDLSERRIVEVVEEPVSVGARHADLLRGQRYRRRGSRREIGAPRERSEPEPLRPCERSRSRNGSSTCSPERG